MDERDSKERFVEGRKESPLERLKQQKGNNNDIISLYIS